MEISEVVGTLRSEMHGNVPCVIAGFMAGQSEKAGSLGYQEEMSPTLRAANSGTNQAPSVMCIQNTVIGRNGKNGPGGKGVQNGVSYTLDTKEPHAVVFENYRHCEFREGIGPLRASGGVISGSGAENLLCIAHGQGNAEICHDTSPTLNCNHEQPYIAGNGYAVRRLLPVECERLQGFPDNWTAYGHDDKPISDTKRYAAIGNSVAIPCVDYIMSGIIDVAPKAGK